MKQERRHTIDVISILYFTGHVYCLVKEGIVKYCLLTFQCLENERKCESFFCPAVEVECRLSISGTLPPGSAGTLRRWCIGRRLGARSGQLKIADRRIDDRSSGEYSVTENTRLVDKHTFYFTLIFQCVSLPIQNANNKAEKPTVQLDENGIAIHFRPSLGKHKHCKLS